MSDPLTVVVRAQEEVARVRGWTSRGEHEKAAKALDIALAALADADAVLHAAPYAAPLLATLHADLDRLTGGTL